MSARGAARLDLHDPPHPLTNEPWMAGSLCNGKTSMFFRDNETGRYQRESEAKEICGLCPVSEECLEYAIRDRIGDGIWGGQNERERTREIRKRAANIRAGSDV